MALERLGLQLQSIFSSFFSLLQLLVTLVVLYQLSSWQDIRLPVRKINYIGTVLQNKNYRFLMTWFAKWEKSMVFKRAERRE